MGRIAQKGNAAINPARQWRAVEQSPTIKPISLTQQAGDGGVPVGEIGQRLFAGAAFGP